jgi:hypothetical protein
VKVSLYKIGTSSKRYSILKYICIGNSIGFGFISIAINTFSVLTTTRNHTQTTFQLSNRQQSAYTMDAPPKAHNGRREQDRALRIVTIMNMIPALGLLIASGVESRNAFPALGLIPMSMSCLIGMTALGSKREGSYVQCALPGADFATATFLMVMMVIRYVAAVALSPPSGEQPFQCLVPL